MTFALSQRERLDADAFLERADVQAMLRNGGQWAIVFGPSNGIGVPVEVTARSADGSVVLREDITDVSSW